MISLNEDAAARVAPFAIRGLRALKKRGAVRLVSDSEDLLLLDRQAMGSWLSCARMATCRQNHSQRGPVGSGLKLIEFHDVSLNGSRARHPEKRTFAAVGAGCSVRQTGVDFL